MGSGSGFGLGFGFADRLLVLDELQQPQPDAEHPHRVDVARDVVDGVALPLGAVMRLGWGQG